MRIRTTSRLRDSRIEDQIREIQRQGDEPPPHSDLHSRGGKDEIKPGDIGAETPLGAQQRAEIEANKALDQSKQYTDTVQQSTVQVQANLTAHETQSNPHLGSQAIQGGSERPGNPKQFEMFFDQGINKPIWWNGEDWVDALGVSVTT